MEEERRKQEVEEAIAAANRVLMNLRQEPRYQVQAAGESGICWEAECLLPGSSTPGSMMRERLWRKQDAA